MWLIVGANGQLGQCLIDVATIQGIDFFATTREQLDITNPSNVELVIGKGNFDIVINAAAWTSVDDAEDHIADALRVNYEGPRNLAQSCLRNSARLIHISTDYVFAGNASTPYEIDTPTDPLNAYGRTKQMGDSIVQAVGTNSFPIIRTAWLYSRYGRNFAKTMALKAMQHLPVKVVNDQLGQPTLASDLAELIVEVGQQNNPPSIIHGTNSGEATWFDFAREIYRLLGVDEGLVTPVSSSEFPTRAFRPSYSVLGHQGFRTNGLTEMRDWMNALESEIEQIRIAVMKEIK